MSHPLLPSTLATAPAAAGAASRHGSFAENVEFLLVGLIIVMGTLAALWVLCEVVGAFFKWHAARTEAAAKAAREATPASASAAPAVAPVLEIPLPVIAAAVAALVDQPHRVVEIKPASVAWSLEGRRQLLTSHKLPR